MKKPRMKNWKALFNCIENYGKSKESSFHDFKGIIQSFLTFD